MKIILIQGIFSCIRIDWFFHIWSLY